MGEAEAWLRELRRDGMAVPELDDEPRIDRGVASAAWGAFLALHPSRRIEFGGVGPIPLSEFESYCRLTALDDLETRAALLRLVRRLDHAYLAQLRAAPERPNG